MSNYCSLISRIDIEKFMGSSSLWSLGTGFWFSWKAQMSFPSKGEIQGDFLYYFCILKNNRFISEITVWMKKVKNESTDTKPVCNRRKCCYDSGEALHRAWHFLRWVNKGNWLGWLFLTSDGQALAMEKFHLVL